MTHGTSEKNTLSSNLQYMFFQPPPLVHEIFNLPPEMSTKPSAHAQTIQQDLRNKTKNATEPFAHGAGPLDRRVRSEQSKTMTRVVSTCETERTKLTYGELLRIYWQVV